MRILRRYILGEVVSHALLGVLVFTFVVFLKGLGPLLDLVVRNSAPLPSVVELFLLTLPSALTLTIPMGVLLGVLLGLSRLAADSEITAMRASGLGSSAFVRVISIFAIAAWLIASANSIWLAPTSAAALSRLQDKLKDTQASFAVQPRVFYEEFKNRVVYVEDVRQGIGASVLRGVFIADISNPASPSITMAREGVVVNDGPEQIRVHLANGERHESLTSDPSQYSIETFDATDIPVAVPPSEATAREFIPVNEMSIGELWYRANHPEADNTEVSRVKSHDTPQMRARWYRVEFQKRLALPASCLVLALVGIPLGLSSRRGGKSIGFVLAILLVFAYYFISLSGISLGRAGKMPAGLAIWMANIVFAIAGIWLLRRVDRTPIELGSLKSLTAGVNDKIRAAGNVSLSLPGIKETDAFARAARRRRLFSARFPLILDDLLLRSFVNYFLLIMGSFLMLTLVFTFFELLGDIVRNHTSLLVLLQYLVNVSPSMIYTLAPLSVLLAVLVTFGAMQKTSELTAMKATGISVYRITLPILCIAFAFSVGLFLFDQFYLPAANQRQETLRNQIKGKPAQTYLQPDRKWIFGEQNAIYFYEFFDPEQNKFGNFSAYIFDPNTFQLVKRVHAARVHWDEDIHKWVLESGWSRTMNGAAIVNFQQFDVATMPELREAPGYFKKEVKQSQEMSFGELQNYIHDLQQSGFDVTPLRVQLHKKLSYPMISFIMAVLALPFAMGKQGKKGALTGVAVAIGIALVYFVAAGLFEAMGNSMQLPAAMAAWAPDLIFGFIAGYMTMKIPT
jgi:LPS export ABC transporter permease LptF/LPS export ABC transporter permease LptG